MTYNEKLQSLFRHYIERARNIATKHGLDEWRDNILMLNEQQQCNATEEEVEAISRLVDDERFVRNEIPQVLGKSYRQCFEDEDFEQIKKLKRVGIYSKVNTLMYAFKLKQNKDDGTE